MRLAVRCGMLQTIGQSFGPLGRLDRSTRRNGSGDPHQLTLDPGLDPIRRTPDQRIQPADRDVKAVDGRDRIAQRARGPVCLE